jgi:hypothetical protein
MNDLLISAVLTGLAVTYLIELVDLVSFGIIPRTTMNKYVALPMSFCGMFLLTELDLNMIVTVPAAAFVSVAISKYINKPTVLNNGLRMPRL